MRINRLLSITAGLTLAIAAGATWAATTPASRQNQPTANSWMQDTVPSTPGVSGWAVVNSDGSLARGHNATSVIHTSGDSFYKVRFNSNVRRCEYNATIGQSGHEGEPSAAFVTVVGASASVEEVFVETYNSSGTGAEEGFHLNVTC